MNGKRTVILALMALCTMLLFCGIASAGTLTINLTTGGTYSGNITVGVEMSGVAGSENATEPVLYGYATDTNMTTAAKIMNSTAGIGGASAQCEINATSAACNFTFDTTHLQDSVNWAFYAIARNGTYNGSGTTYTSASSTGITINNWKPNTPSFIYPADNYILDDSGTIKFAANITRNVTTRAYIEFSGTNPGNSRYSDAEATNGSVEVTLTNMPEGVYKYRWVATDGTDSNSTVLRTLTVKGTKGSSGLFGAQQVGGESTGTNKMILALLVVVVIVIVMKKVKKK